MVRGACTTLATSGGITRTPVYSAPCTENGITRTRRSCPHLPPRPHPACHLRESDDGCCFTWRCSICTDEDGALHRLGDGWLDPYDACVFYVCTVEGIRRGLGDCSHLSYRPRQGCLLSDDEDCCQGECTTCIDEEGETREIGDEWQDRHDSCFYYTCTDDGVTRAPKDCPELPPRPHRDCHLFKEADECCQTWRCLGCVFDGRFYGYGEGWREPTNPCIQYLCTVNSISKVYEHCPAAPSKPHLRCQLIRPDGQCCMEWKCPGCPDPHSVDRVCERSIDLCQSDFECKLGHQCCLVAGCGKECLPVYHPCYATPMCQRMGGRCSDTCGRDEGLITGVCSSDDCVCCVPQASSCKFETVACRERDGRCDSTCGSEEDPVQGLCLDDNCLCCVPKPHRPCPNTSFCNLLDGRCARNCSRGENAFSSMCGASDCVCCIPGEWLWQYWFMDARVSLAGPASVELADCRASLECITWIHSSF
ncbi:kielin/chordin-like protein isoform X2 [Panulirus ornatus]|uniref:kielin/chordin-like protein isoform X2 n=1 Tax=Panulirus ornatus TaxID=150431 RepID=UPI003A8471CA